MKYYIDKPAIERVIGGGRFNEEWFDVKLSVNYESVMDMADTVIDTKTKTAKFVFGQLADWSLTDSFGNKIAVTLDTFNALPFELLQPLFVFINSPDFLAQALAQAKVEK